MFFARQIGKGLKALKQFFFLQKNKEIIFYAPNFAVTIRQNCSKTISRHVWFKSMYFCTSNRLEGYFGPSKTSVKHFAQKITLLLFAAEVYKCDLPKIMKIPCLVFKSQRCSHFLRSQGQLQFFL